MVGVRSVDVDIDVDMDVDADVVIEVRIECDEVVDRRLNEARER